MSNCKEKKMREVEFEIASERQRQIEVEGWTPEHDDGHSDGQLAIAASIYAMFAADAASHDQALRLFQDNAYPDNWPWHAEWFKPKDRRHDLIRAAALIVAEIERLDRKTSDQRNKGKS